MTYVVELSPPPHPLAACAGLKGLPDRILLDSAAGGHHSYLLADPWAIVRDPDELRSRMKEFASLPLPELPPLQGGAVGWIDYEWNSPAAEPDSFRFGLYDVAVAWDHGSGRAWLLSTGLPEVGTARKERAKKRAELFLERLRRCGPPPDAPPPTSARPSSNFTPEAYRRAVEEVLARIRSGRVEQVNLSQRFTAALTEDPWSLYLRLRALNPAPFAVFLESDSRCLASASPERFVRVRNGRVQTFPIKGTRRRGRNEEEDRRIAEELLASEKDWRENRMIAELLRDELAEVCHESRVVEFCRLERHATVQHLVSEVEGELLPGRDPLDVLRRLFPGASITGRPRRRAMEVIAELEDGPRRAYCGSVAWWSFGGDFDSNVLIRTFLIEEGRLSFSAGGGIVEGSDPAAEWEETMHKARALLVAAGGPA